MKKYIYSLFLNFIIIKTTLATSENDAWILSWTTVEKLRNWDITIDDIPKILSYATDYLMSFAWTIAIIFIIIWAYKLALWSLEWDKSKWRETILLAIWGFILAALSWVILKIIIDNFT